MLIWTATQIQTASSVAGVLVAIVGFGLVSYQIKQIGRAGRAAAHAAIFSHSLEVTQLLLDNHEVRPYLYDGKELSSEDPNYSKALFACELLCDFYEHVSLQKENLPSQSVECWDKAIATRYRGNPFLQSYLDAHQHLYAQDLLDALHNGERLLDSSKDKAGDKMETREQRSTRRLRSDGRLRHPSVKG